ncbi:aldolase [Egibacter rhizosphaerae]|uniref:Aldolase n=1 Tax=Egibacter rhizosphaerae TaxID=1670831 RepID=A0A411YEW3_9ACTN|nr:aldolase [Egibacter rhizosphaerae]QBI19750.1 aldolase [Egibacter rhizosphaerae]
MTARLSDDEVARLLAGVPSAEDAHRRGWPGAPATRQPVEVYYVPGDRVTARTPAELGQEAARLLDAHAPDARALADAVADPRLDGLDGLEVAAQVRARTAAKLAAEPVEDLRIDFEDGYGRRDDGTEDADAERTAAAVAAMSDELGAPPFVGLRVKAFADGLAHRSVATLDRFLGTLLDAAGALPAGFTITFPKIVATDHVRAFVDTLEALEHAHGLPEGRLVFEAQIETTASVLGPDGRVALRDLREAADGRLCGAHLGVYDYSAGLGLPPEEQRIDHPACDLVRHLMVATFAGGEVRISDGSVNAVPAGDSAAEVHHVWARHAAAVRRAFTQGVPQGWDLHPSHLVSRYAAVFTHALAGLDDALDRLARWDAGDAGGGVLDEPATIATIAARVQWAVDCGAATPELVRERTGRAVAPRPATIG